MKSPSFSSGVFVPAPAAAAAAFARIAAFFQGLTLVHIFAQLEPLLSLEPAKHPDTRVKKYSG
jgi:hypothetical protein